MNPKPVFPAKPQALEPIFGRRKVIIGMIHLPALPGAPAYDGASMDDLRWHAVEEAQLLKAGGVDGLIVENHDDLPSSNPISSARRRLHAWQ